MTGNNDAALKKVLRFVRRKGLFYGQSSYLYGPIDNTMASQDSRKPAAEALAQGQTIKAGKPEMAEQAPKSQQREKPQQKATLAMRNFATGEGASKARSEEGTPKARSGEGAPKARSGEEAPKAQKATLAAKAFAAQWAEKGYEKGETQSFWISLLHSVFGIDDPTRMIQFEIPVKTITKEKGSDFIDAYIPSTRVLIEQKGANINLTAKARQSDGAELTPYQQARRYAAGLPAYQTPRWIIACNFSTFEVHDMNRPNDPPETIRLSDLEKEYHRLSFLVTEENVHLRKELEISIQAGEIVGVLYDKFLAQYKDPDSPESQKALNKLCVRLVFCLYAEDAGIFGSKDMFHDYMHQFPTRDFRKALIDLFQTLDTRPEDRDPYMDEGLAAFPYVSGGMFAGEIEIPRIDDEIRELILRRASDGFNWSQISPTIFGAVFESTLNPQTRRAGGMHYTSIENIHKVIDPLFLSELKTELDAIKASNIARTRREKAYAFQAKLASLRFFDPACGSGNFLTESYTCLRRLENEALRIIYGGDRVIGDFDDPIRVNINQFYGIEINDFACAVTQTALWIAETQMLQETDGIVGFNIEPLPLKAYTNIREGNALRLDWNEVIPASQLNYIMGNPPFVGARIMNKDQKDDVLHTFGEKWHGVGDLDYVCCWYKKAADYIASYPVRCALVSTNSVTQGTQVANLWKPLMDSGIHIDFAWRTFRWDSEASIKAHVHCVIVGFSRMENPAKKIIFDSPEDFTVAQNINGYLIDAPNIAIDSRSKPLCPVPEIGIGNKPIDGGNYLFTKEEMEEFIEKEPRSRDYFRPWWGSQEFINGQCRYCLWLGDCSPAELRSMPQCLKRVQAVRDYRLASPSPGTVKLADTPTRFHVENMPKGHYIVIPQVSSQKRPYIPMGYMDDSALCSDKVRILVNGTLYIFGVLESSVHMAWMRAICCRLKSDYSYTVKDVYNNFPWPMEEREGLAVPEGYPIVTAAQREKIERTAQGILDARAAYPDCSLADLYDSLTMPQELRRAHRANDAAVLEAYGFPPTAPEPALVSRLFDLYRRLT